MVVEETRKVSWGTVIGGMVVAGFVGFVTTAFSTAAGMAAYVKLPSKALGLLIAVGVPAAVVGLMYATLRRRSPDFARGVLIGLCLVVIWAGICGGSFVGARIGG
ncbi:MAG TPA: hypothetical protein VGF48_13465 [Thermoanaerobaculia bacterium]|jgi:hypothetical protein